ncbi:MAG: TonB-dependent receptor [Hyphomonadaceae bacterium]
MKSWLSKKDRLLAGTIMAGAAVTGLAGPAMAQDGDDEIVVTGSRIPQPNLQSVSPITQVGSEQISGRGVTRVEDMLNELPMTMAGQDSGVSNAASGAATVDLRGLGSARTLVLINGRRTTAGDVTNSAADLNLIPGALVDRVEVLTGGASSIYGADAVAGVVNFIMQDDFEGVRFDAGYSFYQSNTEDDQMGGDAPVAFALARLGNLEQMQSISPRFFRVPEENQVDGETWTFTTVFGANTEDGRGNVTAYLDYRNVGATRQDSRGFSACNFFSGGTPNLDQDLNSYFFIDDEFVCGGSSTTFPSRLQATRNSTFTIGNFNVRNAFSSSGLPSRQAGPGATLTAPVVPYNFAPDNYFQRPDERYSGGAFARYEINPHIELYAEAMFMDDRTRAQIAPSGAFRGGGFGNLNGFYAVNCDNPFLGATQVALICGADIVPDFTGQALTDLVDDIVAAGDNPDTALDESDPVAVEAYITTNVNGVVQENCPDPVPDVADDPMTPEDESAGTVGNQAICLFDLGHRNVNGNPRIADLRHTQYRFVLGSRGELTEGWNYDVYGLFNRMVYQQNYLNEFSLSRLQRALINDGGQCAVNTDDDATNDDIGCVPIDLFDDGGPTDAQLNYVVQNAFQMGQTQTSVFSGAVTGDLGTLGMTSPWAEDGIGVAFGVEARHEELELRTDANFCPSTILGTVSDLIGQGGTTCPVDGAYSVFEVFGEMNVPIVQNQPFFESLGLDLSYRFSDYSISGGVGYHTDTYGIGGHWAPTEDIRFRAAYQRAARAPNIVELFAPQVVGLAGVTDPCSGGTPTASLAACQAMDVTAGQYGTIAANPAAQYNGLGGGNPSLQPEIADTVTIGFVFTPTFLPGLAVSVDWYNIQLEDRVGPIGTDTILANCVAAADALSPFCQAVVRAPGTGSLWLGPNGYVIDLNTNSGGLETTGIDVNARYRLDIGAAGGLGFNYTATFVDEYIVSPFGGAPFDCAGLYGPACAGAIGGFGNPMPDYRHLASVTWETPMTGLALTGSWRHIDEVLLEPSAAAFTAGGVDYVNLTDAVLDSQNYFDLSGTWDIWENVTFRAGVNNITDEDPPLTGATNCPSGPCNGNTWPGVYDALGRYFFFGVTADF